MSQAPPPRCFVGDGDGLTAERRRHEMRGLVPPDEPYDGVTGFDLAEHALDPRVIRREPMPLTIGEMGVVAQKRVEG